MHPLCKFEVSRVGARQDPWPALAIKTVQTDQTPCRVGFSVAYEYHMTCTLATRFVANQAEFRDAQDSALKNLVGGFFTEARSYAHRLASAIECGDRDEARTIMRKLLKSMHPDNYEIVRN